MIRVRDSGIGIPAAMLPRVFDLFVRVERRRKVPRAGMGIGLSVSRWLVDLHGGTIEARSAGADQGSEFVIMLPLSPSPARDPGVSRRG